MRLIEKRPFPNRIQQGGAAGFTILELAITLTIMAMLASAMLVPLVTQVTQRKVTATEKILEQAAEALIGYATATGRFPCPATGLPNTTGVESFGTGGTAANGICTSNIGFLPAVTLGFSPVDGEGYAMDGWATPQNRVRYAVAQNVTQPNGTILTNPTNPFTKTNGMRDATAGQIAQSKLLFVCGSGAGVVTTPLPSCSAAVTLTDNAPVVLWSVGANAANGGTSTDEAQNPHPNLSATPSGGSADRIFVSRTRRDISGNEFDDIVTWISVGNLVSRMVQGGQLP